MGWIILAVLIFLLLLPFLIPVRVQARYNENEKEWAVFYGPLQIAPDTAVHLTAARAKLAKIFRYPMLVLKFIGKAIGWLFGILVILLRTITWPVRALLGWMRKRKTERARKKYEAEQAALSSALPEAEEADKMDEHLTDTSHDDEGSDGELRISKPSPPAMDSIEDKPSEEAPEPPSDETDGTDQPSDPESPWEIDEEKPSTRPEDSTTSEKVPPQADDAQQGQSRSDADSSKEKKSGIFAKVAAFQAKFAEYRNLYQMYSPLAKKLLRRVLRLMRESTRAFRFRKFDGRVSVGGDPATLGAMLGWHHALGAAVHPSIPRHLVFEPDFESEELAPRGTLDLELVIWPYRILLPTLAFIVTLPWWSAFKAYRSYKKHSV